MRKYLLIMFAACTLGVWAAPKADYYAAADGKSGIDLFNALHDIIVKDFTKIDYDGLISAYEVTDATPDGRVWDMYGGCTFSFSNDCGNYSKECDCYNREHSLPKSWWGKAKNEAYSSIFHVVPTDGYVNNRRSNYAFGEVKNATYTYNGCRLGANTLGSYRGTVFEPRDEYKGDFARGYMAVLIQFGGKIKFGQSNGAAIFNDSISAAGHFGLTPYGLQLLLKWHRQDPVSQKEIDRNNGIEQKQGNRNPFIDYPCLAEYLWGNLAGKTVSINDLEATYASTYSGGDGCTQSTTPVMQTPLAGAVINVGTANLNQPLTYRLDVQGRNLGSNLRLALSGRDASCFSTAATLSASQVNNGTALDITYTPNATGTHSATLTFSSSEITAFSITLQGTCLPALAEPQQRSFYVVSDNVGQTHGEPLLVKATNITDGLTLRLSGQDADAFSLSATSLTAAQALQGQSVAVNFTPQRVGNHEATLLISSNSQEFTPVSVSLLGLCEFRALEATEVTATSFVANWTNAGVGDYLLDVYTVTAQASEPQVSSVDEYEGTTSGTTAGYTDLQLSSCIRLGSGSNTGSVTYSNLDLHGATLLIGAKYYNKDATAQLVVTVGTTEVASLTLTEEVSEYSVPLPEELHDATTVRLANAVKGARVYVDYLHIARGGNTEVHTSLSGYPASVGNVTTYEVTHLQKDSTYYYTITLPDGTVSESVEVITNGTNANTRLNQPTTPEVSLEGDFVRVSGAAPGTLIELYDVSGRLITRHTATSAPWQAFLHHRGAYLLRIGHHTHKLIRN